MKPRSLGRAANWKLWPCCAILVGAFGVPGPLWAKTLYVDDDNAAKCPCPVKDPSHSRCGTKRNPFSCITDAVAVDRRIRPFDTILVRDGIYDNAGVPLLKGGKSRSKPLTLASENLHGALIAPPAGQVGVFIQANYVTVRGFRITSSTQGIYIWGADPGMTDRGIGNVVEDVEIFNSFEGVKVQRECSDTRLTRLDVHDSGYFGLNLENLLAHARIRDTVVEKSHVHHNRGSGIIESNAERTIVRDSEIDHNGFKGSGHGFYMKGYEGLIEGNKVHHNANYGVHLWAAPRGSAARHYIVEGNDIFENGSGIVVGGSTVEASPHADLPPGDGLPHYVEVRHNFIHDNSAFGFNYIGFRCDSSANDNLFHHNIVSRNHDAQVIISNAGSMLRPLQVWDNTIVGGPFEEDPILVFLGNTSLPADALKGNTYDMSGADSSTSPGPFWFRCTSPDRSTKDTFYSFKQFQTGGILQDNSCNTTIGCVSTTLVMDDASRWASAPAGGFP